MKGSKERLYLNEQQWPENSTLRKQQDWGRNKRAPFLTPAFKQQNTLTLDMGNVFDTPNDPDPISADYFEQVGVEAANALDRLNKGQGDCLDKGTPMLGWQSLPDSIPADHIKKLKDAAAALREKIDVYVSVGIGGSYLGIEATIKALTHTWFNQLSKEQRGGAPEIYFLGQNIDPDFFRDTLDMLAGKLVGVNVISKSGTTTETAIAFRILRALLEESLGDSAKELIVATTDAEKGALRTLAAQKGYETFVVPNDVGGRFSVLTDVGLFGIALAGIDIEELLAGAADMKARASSLKLWDNPALLHSTARTCAWRKGKKVEVVATNSESFFHIARWMEQLFPESEGKDGKGLWVSPSLYSEKLHANGQMVQQGQRNLIETFLKLEKHDNQVEIPTDGDNLDNLNYLPESGKSMNDLNGLAVTGPAYAHYNGGVPNMTVNIPERNAYNIGQLYYLFEQSVAISGYLLGINPFVQPGVEDYKKAMFALAGKPGFEELGEKIRAEIDEKKK